jgi:cardiolipin synthase A/B
MKRLLRLVLSRTTFILLLLLAQIAFFFVTVNFLAQYQYVHTALYAITVIIITYLIYKEENPVYKLSWIIPILIFPLFGGLFYLFYKNANISKKAKTLYDTIESERTTLTKDLKLTHQTKTTTYLRKIGWPSYTHTKTTFFDSGKAVFDDIIKTLKLAKSSIYLEFFIISKGKLWDEILEILKEKAKHGVDVKLIYDDYGSSTLPYKYTKTLKSYGIEAYNFNPMKPHLNFQMNYRNHRKIIVIDHTIGYTGGINIGDEYINLVQPFGHWQDMGIKLEENAVYSLLLGFNDHLRFTTKDRTKITYKPIFDDIKDSKSIVTPFFDAPLDKEYTTKNVYMQMIHEAKSYIYITTPYLILDYDLVTALKFAASAGVDVNIIIPYIPDKKIVFMISESYAKDLAKHNIKVYKFKPGFMHSKMMIVDGIEALIGTVNLDYRSLYLHFENTIYLKNDPSIKDMKDHFEILRKDSIDILDLKKPNFIYSFIQIILKGFSSIL